MIRTVHAHSDDASYRSMLVDCDALAAMRGEIGDQLHVSLSARPEFHEDGNVGYRTFTAEDIGAIRVPADRLDELFCRNRTLLAEIVLKRWQSPGVFGFI